MSYNTDRLGTMSYPVTVRLEYGGMRFENDVDEFAIIDTVQGMAQRHGIGIGAIEPYDVISARGRVLITGAYAIFKVIWKDNG